MRLEDFWQQPLSGEAESDWLDWCELDIASGQLSLGDPYHFPNQQVVIEAAPGHYYVQAKVRDYDNERRISALRALMTDQIVSVEPAGEVTVDIGKVMACDYPSARAAHIQRNMDDGEEFSGNFLGLFQDQFGVTWLNNVMIPYVQAGWGDGVYPAYRYVDSAGIGIGGEIVFIADET